MSIDEDPEGHEEAALDSIDELFASRRILEIGCGDGRLTERFARSATFLMAIDPDADAIAELADHLPDVDARAIGVEELALPAQTFDVVVFSWSL